MTEPSPKGFRDPETPKIDPTVPHSARVYDYLLGGQTNFEADRKAAFAAGAAVGGIEVAQASVRSNRVFLGQVVRWLAGPAGMRQFLDIGTGIPNDDNVHAVALAVAPDARVVYVDNDPIVLAHAHELLNTAPDATAYIHGDLLQPETVLAQAAELLDLDRPVAVVLNAVLHHVPERDDPYSVVARLMDGVASGSYLAMSHLTDDLQTEEMRALSQSVPSEARYMFAVRSRADFARFFEGLELVDPGIVPIDQWRPDEWDITPEGRYHFGAVGRKP
ncbi:MAG TPA: SAM-dependent methyltransferase [Acidimicrobiales bacterium]|nr:SAM-dependent methyltransferase [Acidimicrobiales bacterium]